MRKDDGLEKLDTSRVRETSDVEPDTAETKYIGETEKNLAMEQEVLLAQPKPWWKRLLRL